MWIFEECLPFFFKKFDVAVILNSHRTLRQGIHDASDLICKRRRAPHTFLDAWKADIIINLEQTFMDPLVPCKSTYMSLLMNAECTYNIQVTLIICFAYCFISSQVLLQSSKISSRTSRLIIYQDRRHLQTITLNQAMHNMEYPINLLAMKKHAGKESLKLQQQKDLLRNPELVNHLKWKSTSHLLWKHHTLNWN